MKKLSPLFLLILLMLSGCKTLEPKPIPDNVNEEELSFRDKYLSYIIPAKCAGVKFVEGGESFKLFSRWDRDTERHLKISGALNLIQPKCSIERMWLSVDLTLEVSFTLGRWGRPADKDRANYLVPYTVAVISARDQIVAQDYQLMKLVFEPNEETVMQKVRFNKDLLLDDLGRHGPYVVYIGAVEPAKRQHSNQHEHPMPQMLLQKPAL